MMAVPLHAAATAQIRALTEQANDAISRARESTFQTLLDHDLQSF
jgi:hypothetical protein